MMPGMYSGASLEYQVSIASYTKRRCTHCALKTSEPAIPPVPPSEIKLALENALFHVPRILFAWKTMTVGMLALQPAVMSMAPRY